jgi:hypothetical protein
MTKIVGFPLKSIRYMIDAIVFLTHTSLLRFVWNDNDVSMLDVSHSDNMI